MNDPQPPEVTQGWLERARSNLVLARLALKTRGVLPEDACFHAQQCAEKALKGLLSQLGIPFPRTHAIEVLLDLLKVNGIKSQIQSMKPLFFRNMLSKQDIRGNGSRSPARKRGGL